MTAAPQPAPRRPVSTAMPARVGVPAAHGSLPPDGDQRTRVRVAHGHPALPRPGEGLPVGARAVLGEERLGLVAVGRVEHLDVLLAGHHRGSVAGPHPVPLAPAAAQVEPLRDHRHQAARHAEVPVAATGDPGAHGRVVEQGRQTGCRAEGGRPRHPVVGAAVEDDGSVGG